VAANLPKLAQFTRRPRSKKDDGHTALQTPQSVIIDHRG